jgi:hypothetical protein
MPSDSPAVAETAKKAMAEQTKLNRAYAQVFGLPGQMSDAQRIVWEDLAQMGFERLPLTPVQVAGPIDPLRLAHNDGKRTYFLNILERIRRATEAEEPKSVTVIKS